MAAKKIKSQRAKNNNKKNSEINISEAKSDPLIFKYQPGAVQSFIIGAIIGSAAFLLIYGVKILDVRYDEWLLYATNPDLMQHYVGWKLYRVSDWHFPAGLMDNSIYPYLQSVVYTDSIPVVSLIFKLLSPVLPETFQFFGIYGLFTFAMQGGAAKLLLRKIIKDDWVCSVACVLFVISCPLLQRMYFHTALASQYLILLAMLPWLYRKELASTGKKLIYYTLLGVLTVSVQFTLFGIVSVVFLGFVIWECLDVWGDKKKLLIRLVTYIAAYILAALAALAFWGAFSVKVENEADGLGVYSANLNSLFNPLSNSTIFSSLSSTSGQYEGLAYIGVSGIILMTVAVIGILICKHKPVKERKKELIAFGTSYILLWIIALSPTITLGNHILVTIPWPQFVLDAWSMFRSSGRFLWPVLFASILIFIYFSKKVMGKYLGILLLICVCLQCYEYSDWMDEIGETLVIPQEAAEYSANQLSELDLSNIKHIQLMDEYDFYTYYSDEAARRSLIGYGCFAADNDMTVSNFHFSRENLVLLRNRINQCEQDLAEGNAAADTVYVFERSGFERKEAYSKYKNVEYVYTDTEVICFRK